jgi:hypothetical protein
MKEVGRVIPHAIAARHDNMHVLGGVNTFTTRPIWTMLDTVKRTLVE